MTTAAGTLVFGSITQDHVETPGPSLRGELGGSASYFALAARHFGPVRVVGAVGRDREEELRRTLSFADLRDLTVSDQPTYTWHARRDDPGGEATTLRRFQGAYEGYRPALTATEPVGAAFLASFDPEMQLAVAAQLPAGTLVGGDTMDIFIGGQRRAVERMIGAVKLLFLTEAEMEMLAHTRGAAAPTMLLDAFPLAAVVVKRGAAGAVLWTHAGARRLPAWPAEVLDPTGAGDALAGGFMGRLAEIGGLSAGDLRDPLEWGMVAASFAIEGLGLTRLAEATRADLEERLAAYRAGLSV